MGPVIVEVLDGRGAVRQRIDVPSLPAAIGRAWDSAVVLDDPYVDAVHAHLVASDRWIAIQDAGSVNGIRSANGAATPAISLASGDTIRVGRTTLRLIDPALPLSPALVDSRRATPNIAWLTSPAVIRGIIVVTIALFVLSQLADSADRRPASSLISFVLGLFLIIDIWAAGWAVVNRIVSQRFRFAAHVAIASLALSILLVVSQVFVIMTFLFPGASAIAPVQSAVTCAILALPISLHLAMISTMTSARRWRIAGGVAGVLFVFMLITGYVDRRKFSTAATFTSTIEPLPASWVPAQTSDEFFSATGSLRTKVDAIAAERP